MKVVSGAKYRFDWPVAFAMSGVDLFVANYNGASVTEVNASTGALMKVISGLKYHFDEPGALALTGTDLFVGNYGSAKITEVDASTGALMKVIWAEVPVGPAGRLGSE